MQLYKKVLCSIQSDVFMNRFASIYICLKASWYKYAYAPRHRASSTPAKHHGKLLNICRSVRLPPTSSQTLVKLVVSARKMC